MPATRKVTAQRLDASGQFDLGTFGADASDAVDTKYTRIPVLPKQGAIGRDGRGPFTYDLERIKANMRANGQRIPIFIDHQPGRAYGWCDNEADFIAMADGTYELPVEYTTEGLSEVQSKAYSYNSPTWWFIQDPNVTDRQAGEIVGIDEVSLTNSPNQYLRSLNSTGSAGYTVDVPLTDAEMNAEQLAALGLAEGASHEDVLAAINSLKAGADRADAIVAEAGAAADADAPAVIEAAANSRVAAGALVTKQAYDEAVTAKQAAETALATAQQAQQVAEQALTTFKAEQAQQAAVASVDAAIAAGKFTPAERDECMAFATSQGADKFTAWAAKRSAHAVLKPLATPDTKDETFGLTEQELAICKREHIKPEIFAKNKRKSA